MIDGGASASGTDLPADGGHSAMPYAPGTTHRERWSLRGPVRACTLRRTWFACGADGQCGTDARGDNARVEFRPDGALTLHHHENHDGSAFESILDYDSSGRLVSVRNGGHGGVTNASIYEYDAQGRLERVVERRSDGRERVATSYEYSVDGSHRKIDHLDAEWLACGATHWVVEGTDVGYPTDGATRIVLHYDARSLPVEATFTDGDGQVLTRVNLVYDERGLLVEETQTVIELPLPADVRSKLTPSDLEEFRAILGGGRVPNRRVHRYDAGGRRIETRSSHFGGLGQDRQTFDYNERGDQIVEVMESRECQGSLDDGGQLVENPASLTTLRSEARFRYDYDTGGNWVKKVIEGRSDPNREFSVSTIETRDIQYYAAP